MAQLSKLGKRLVCDDCNAKYYDLNRERAACPKCGCEKIRKASVKSDITPPVSIDVEEDEEFNGDEMEPLEDLELSDDDKKASIKEDAENVEEAEVDGTDDLPVGSDDDTDEPIDE